MFKLQITIEFIIILAVILLIAVGFFYYYVTTLSHQKTLPEIVISDFQIDNFSPGANSCNVGVSFQSTSNIFTANQFNILAQNYTGAQLNLSVSTNNYTSYATPENNYQFNYYFSTSNSMFCNMFTPFVSSTTGEITGLLLNVSGKEELYMFNTPVKTAYQ